MIKKITDTAKRWRLFWFLLTIPTLILIAAYLYVATMAALTQPSDITRETAKKVVWKNRPMKANLVFDLDTPQGAAKVKRTPVDVVFCLDTSGSMGNMGNPNDNLPVALDATRNFARILADPVTRLSFIQYDNSPQLLCPLTQDYSEFEKVLSEIKEGGGTNIAAALGAAIAELEQKSSTTPRRRFVVLISDGQDNVTDSQQVARQAAQKGITLIGIGVGYSANQDFYGQVFQTPHYSHCCFPDVSQLNVLFNKMVGNISNTQAKGVGGSLREHYKNHTFEYFPHDTDRFFLSTVDTSNGLLQWSIPRLYDKPFSIYYSVIPKKIGVHRLATQESELAYLRPDQSQNKILSNLEPHLLILSPWLLFLLYLPALLYLVFCILARRGPAPLADLENIPDGQIPQAMFQPVPPSKRPVVRPVPTVVIGLGGYGGQVLCHLKHTVAELMPWDVTDQFLYIHLDTDRQQAPFSFCDSDLGPEEIFQFPANPDLNAFISEIHANSQNYPQYASWLDHATLNRMDAQQKNVATGAQGNRQIARLALLLDYGDEDPVFSKLADWVTLWLKKPRGEVQVVIVGSSTGGLSSGIFPDVAAFMRKCLRDCGAPAKSAVYGFLTQTSPEDWGRRNHDALLQELRRFQLCHGGETKWPSLAKKDGPCAITLKNPLLDRMFVSTTQEHPAAVADQVFIFCESSQRKTLLDILGDAAYRVRALEYEHIDAFYHRAEVNSIRYPAGRVLEELCLKSLRAIMEQLTKTSFQDDLLVLDGGDSPQSVIEQWADKDYYRRLGSLDHGEVIRGWHRLLLSDPHPEEIAAAETPDTQVVQSFYQSVLEHWLNGTEPDAFLPAATVLSTRQDRLASALGFFLAIREILTNLEEQDRMRQDWLEKMKVLHERIWNNLSAWRQVLVENDKPVPGGWAAGLVKHLHGREAELKNQEKLLGNIPCRTYLFGNDGQPACSSDQIFRQRMLPYLEDKTSPLALRFHWAVSDRLDIRMRFKGNMEHIFTPDNAAGEEIFKAFFSYFSESLLPDVKGISVFDKLTPKILERSRIAEGNLEGEYVLFTLMEHGHEAQANEVSKMVSQNIPASRRMARAGIDNPLVLSLLSINPSLHSATILPKPLAREWNHAIFNYPPEREALTLKRRMEERTGTRIPFFNPTLRDLAKPGLGYSPLAWIVALNYLILDKSPLQDIWVFKRKVERRELAYGGPPDSRFRALWRLLGRGRDIFGDPIELAPTYSDWKKLEANQQRQALQNALNKLPFFTPPGRAPIEEELSLFLEEILGRELKRLEN